MSSYTADGIVLKRTDLGDKDRILTILTKERGKLSAVAKGARRPGSKLAGTSEPFTFSRMQLGEGRNLEVLTQSEIRESFPAIRRDIKKLAYGIYILELTNAFTDEHIPNPDLFDTLLSILYVIESGTDPEVAARYFDLQILGIMGYDPHFDDCLQCGREFGRERIVFSPSLGGIVCRECGMEPADSVHVPGAIASYIAALRLVEPQKIKEMKIPEGARRDLSRMLRRHIRYRLEHDLKSADFIDAITSDKEN